MVGSAMTVSSTDIVAQCVERAWQTITSTPKAVFKSLRLYTVDERRLDNPALKSWIRYTAEYNKQNPNTKSSMIGTLVEYYSEGLLLQMIIAAKNNPNTEKIASELQRALLLYQISRHEQRKREMRSDANERAECNCYTLHRRMAEAETRRSGVEGIGMCTPREKMKTDRFVVLACYYQQSRVLSCSIIALSTNRSLTWWSLSIDLNLYPHIPVIIVVEMEKTSLCRYRWKTLFSLHLFLDLERVEFAADYSESGAQ
ncbi:hypothetical protein GQ600_14682 [Phytophthora cactorum]|nr:hypothetical protein GQ600_14682 [Phytophthora cactorum]